MTSSRNRETPCAALPAGASAPHRAVQGWEPSTSDRSPGVTLRPIKVIARQSLRSGGRFALSTPPAPVTRLGHANGRLPRPGCPVRSSPTCRRLHPGYPEHPVSTTPSRPFPVARFRLRWQRMIPHRPRFRLVNPVGSRSRPPPQGEALLARGRSSGSGWHALAGASPTLLPLFRQVKRYFSIHRVIHQITPPSPEVSGSSTIRAQGDAQLYAQLARQVRRIGGRRSGLVDDRQSSGHNHRRDVADRHPSRLHHHHSIAHVEHPRAPAAVLRGGCFISRMLHHSDTRSDRTSV